MKVIASYSSYFYLKRMEVYDMGLFSGLFDFNGNGKLDGMEKAAGMATMMSIMDEIEAMDEDERRENLEDAGLDPDDYDEF